MTTHIGIPQPDRTNLALCKAGPIKPPDEGVTVSEVEARRDDLCKDCTKRYDEIANAQPGP